MFIVNNRAIFFFISGLFMAAAAVVIGVKGLEFGIDFQGGSIMEVAYPENRPSMDELSAAVAALSLGEVKLQPAGERALIIRTKHIGEAEHRAVLEALSLGGSAALTEQRFNSIGPVIGKELRTKAWIAIAAVILGIVLFVWFAFRHVSEPVASWKYGVITIFALLHDILIPTGVAAFLGIEIDTLFIIALLSIMGLSVHDSIVVFDRVRENLRLKRWKVFSETVGKSLEQTFVRSINTSVTIILVLLSLYLFGPESTKNFSLILLIGMFFGTYSSIFFGSPLLVTIKEWQDKKRP